MGGPLRGREGRGREHEKLGTPSSSVPTKGRRASHLLVLIDKELTDRLAQSPVLPLAEVDLRIRVLLGLRFLLPRLKVKTQDHDILATQSINSGLSTMLQLCSGQAVGSYLPAPGGRGLGGVDLGLPT